MFSLFTSSKTRLEQRMLRQCLNTEKPQAAVAMNRLVRPDALVQPVAKLDDHLPVALNTLGRDDPPAGDGRSHASPVGGKTRRRTPRPSF
jgi:hypothetical protein